MDHEDPLAELELVARIEASRARQHEGKARQAEAQERALAGERAERRELRETEVKQRQLSSFMTPTRSDVPFELIVLESNHVNEGTTR